MGTFIAALIGGAIGLVGGFVAGAFAGAAIAAPQDKLNRVFSPWQNIVRFKSASRDKPMHARLCPRTTQSSATCCGERRETDVGSLMARG